MPTLSMGINTALQAIMANTQAIEIIEHNVANANTVGYRRQSAMLTATVAAGAYASDYGSLAGQRGTGVTISQIQRFNLEYFDGRFRAVSGETKNWEARKDVLVQLETTLSETSDNGLLPKMDEFFAGWQALSADPTSTALRSQLLETAQGLASAINSRYQNMAQLRTDQNLAIQDQALDINQMATQVAELNSEISRVLSVGEQPNDLMDKRDLLLDQLSEATGAVSNVQANGEMMVSIGGHVLVNGHTTYAVEANADGDGLYQLKWADGQSFSAPTGTVKGLLAARDGTIVGQMTGLNTLAAGLMTQVNTIHNAGYGTSGAHGLDFFTYSNVPGEEAATITVNSALAPEDVATAAAIDQPADSTVADQMTALQDALVMNSGTATLAEFYNSQITTLGLEIQTSKNNVSGNNLVRTALSNQRESVAGVNLDEEAANMVKFQRAYQAAARLMNVYDEMLNTVINGMGLAGR